MWAPTTVSGSHPTPDHMVSPRQHGWAQSLPPPSSGSPSSHDEAGGGLPTHTPHGKFWAPHGPKKTVTSVTGSAGSPWTGPPPCLLLVSWPQPVGSTHIQPSPPNT